MGNCTCRKLRKKTAEQEVDENGIDSNTQNKGETTLVEDVTYATIDHSNAKVTGTLCNALDYDCDYATVNIPVPESSGKDYADDYVLMA